MLYIYYSHGKWKQMINNLHLTLLCVFEERKGEEKNNKLENGYFSREKRRIFVSKNRNKLNIFFVHIRV